jgi:plastocyanin
MRLVTLAAALILIFGAAVSLTAASSKSKTHTVNMENMKFDPAELTVKAGDTIVWVNKDLVPHTATSAAKGLFDSGFMEAGQSWKYKVKGKGDVAYICTFHPTMKGLLRVK